MNSYNWSSTDIVDTKVSSEDATIFLTQLPKSVTAEQLYTKFAVFGSINKILPCSENSDSTQNVYIKFENAVSATIACSVSPIEIDKKLSVDVRPSEDYHRIFVGGIPDEKTKDQIWKELAHCGMKQIQDVIMYRSYTDRNKNRGFVFVVFPDHQTAAIARTQFRYGMLFGRRIQVDWATPLQNVNEEIMNKVRKLFIRNLPVIQTEEEFARNVIYHLFRPEIIEKVYKHKDYAFVHFHTRRDAQQALAILKQKFMGTDIEVTWAKPPMKSKNAQTKYCSRSPSDRNLDSFLSGNTNDDALLDELENQTLDIINFVLH